jgi:hypothetical protein
LQLLSFILYTLLKPLHFTLSLNPLCSKFPLSGIHFFFSNFLFPTRSQVYSLCRRNFFLILSLNYPLSPQPLSEVYFLERFLSSPQISSVSNSSPFISSNYLSIPNYHYLSCYLFTIFAKPHQTPLPFVH